MTFNNDANVTDVFAKLYEMVIGTRADGPTILEASYSVGLAVGIMLFFNHFASWKITVDPTPIEVEMRLYEENLNKTLIKNGGRKGVGDRCILDLDSWRLRVSERVLSLRPESLPFLRSSVFFRGSSV